MKKKNILVVDDERAITELLRLQLEEAGYEVRTALNTDKGLELFGRQRPDLVLLDALMPGKDGFVFIKEITGPDGNLLAPVLVMSGKEDVGRIIMDMKTSGFLEKPFTFAAVLEEIKKILV